MKSSMCIFILSLFYLHKSESKSCADLASPLIINDLGDDATGTIGTISGITGLEGASLSGGNTTEYLNISQYVDVSINSGNILFSAKSNFRGLLDFPTPASIKGLTGDCTAICSTNNKTFTVDIYVTDSNTARPSMSQPSYELTVHENYPVNVPLTALTVSASDADREAYSRINFTSSDPTFALTTALQTSDWPATYTAQLMLMQPLDYSVKRAYSVSVVATDPGGLSATSDVTITVADVDNKQPSFVEKFYTASVPDKTAVGVITVQPSTIKAEDPDTGGPLTYSLITNDAVWSSYFHIDPDDGTVRLTKAIPETQQIPEELSFTVQALESQGQFSCHTTLRIRMVPTPGTPEVTSVTGYIVGMAVLGTLLVVVIVVALVDRRRRNKYQRPPERKSDAEAQVAGYQTEYGKPSRISNASYGNPTFTEPDSKAASFASKQHPAANLTSSQFGAQQNTGGAENHTDDLSNSLQDLKNSLQSTLDGSRAPIGTPERSRSESPRTRTPTPPPIRSKNPSVSSFLPPIIEADSTPTSPSDVNYAKPFFPPDEPMPDYSLKTVAFCGTVDCVEIEDTRAQEEETRREEAARQAELDRAELSAELEGTAADMEDAEEAGAQVKDELTHDVVTELAGPEGEIKTSVEVVTGEEESADEMSTVM